MTGSDIQRLEPSLGDRVRAAYVIDDEGLVDPSQLIGSLAARLVQLGVVVSERSTVSAFRVENGRVRAVEVDGDRSSCGNVVIAGGTWSGDVLAKLGARVRMQSGKGYSFAVDLPLAPTHPMYLGEKHVAVSPMAGRPGSRGRWSSRATTGASTGVGWRRSRGRAGSTSASGSTPDDLMDLIRPVGGRPADAPGRPAAHRPGSRSRQRVRRDGPRHAGGDAGADDGGGADASSWHGARPAGLTPFGQRRP